MHTWLETLGHTPVLWEFRGDGVGSILDHGNSSCPWPKRAQPPNQAKKHWTMGLAHSVLLFKIMLKILNALFSDWLWDFLNMFAQFSRDSNCQEVGDPRLPYPILHTLKSFNHFKPLLRQVGGLCAIKFPFTSNRKLPKIYFHFSKFWSRGETRAAGCLSTWVRSLSGSAHHTRRGRFLWDNTLDPLLVSWGCRDKLLHAGWLTH